MPPGRSTGEATLVAAYISTRFATRIAPRVTRIRRKVREFLIANADMESDVESYWKVGAGWFSFLRTTSGYQSATALEYFAGLFAGLLGSSGPVYNTEESMDRTCLTPGSKWEIRAQIRLFQPLLGGGAACSPGTTCPQVALTIRDGGGSQIFAVAVDGYVEAWNANGYNELRATMELPSAGRQRWRRIYRNWGLFRLFLIEYIDGGRIQPLKTR